MGIGPRADSDLPVDSHRHHRCSPETASAFAWSISTPGSHRTVPSLATRRACATCASMAAVSTAPYGRHRSPAASLQTPDPDPVAPEKVCSSQLPQVRSFRLPLTTDRDARCGKLLLTVPVGSSCHARDSSAYPCRTARRITSCHTSFGTTRPATGRRRSPAPAPPRPLWMRAVLARIWATGGRLARESRGRVSGGESRRWRPAVDLATTKKWTSSTSLSR